MKYKKKNSDLLIFDLTRFKDSRGFLTKFFYSELMNQYNFKVDDVYSTVSHKHVVRGLHHQFAPNGQAKLVTCLSGSFWDLAVDLRRNSSSYGKLFSYKLSYQSDESLLIPAGFSHGTVSLENKTVMLSICSGKYMPEYEGGINIKSLNLDFLPKGFIDSLIISPKDSSLPSLEKVLLK